LQLRASSNNHPHNALVKKENGWNRKRKQMATITWASMENMAVRQIRTPTQLNAVHIPCVPRFEHASEA
jgi:hypothetical protein